MTAKVIYTSEKLSTLSNEYLNRVSQRLRTSEYKHEDYINCLIYRDSLYILREQLFIFIQESIENFMRHLAGTNRPSIKQVIKDKVRELDPNKSKVKSADDRKTQIDTINESYYT